MRYQLNTLHLNKKKIVRLLEKDIFKVVTSADIPNNALILNSCFVDKVKYTSTDKGYKISWLVVQNYNDQEKDLILTQSPTI